MAGGRGERMGAATDQRPKPMIPVLGRPLLEHQLLWLKAHGFSRVFLSLGYKAKTVSDYFGDGARWGLCLEYHVEAVPRGTAGAIKDMMPRLGPEAVVVYGDMFIDMDLGKLLEFHGAHDMAATVCVGPTDHPLDSDLARVEGKRLTAIFRPKQGEAFEPLSLAALWVVRRELMELAPDDKPSDFGREIFPAALKEGLPLAAYKTGELMADLGTPQRLERFLKTRASA